MRATAKKTGKYSVFNIVAATQREQASVSRFVQEEFEYVIGNVQVGSADQLAEVIQAADGVVDFFLVDADIRPFLKRNLVSEARTSAKHSALLGYSDSDVWARSIADEVRALKTDVDDLQVTVLGVTHQALRTILHLLEHGATVTLTGQLTRDLLTASKAMANAAGQKHALRLDNHVDSAIRRAHVLVAFHKKRPVVTSQMLRLLKSNSIVFDASLGAVMPEAIEWAAEHGIRVVRPDMRAALTGELSSLLGTTEIASQLLGKGEIGGVPIVAGGLVGRRGDVVVDSIASPTRVVGIADGTGRLLYHDDQFKERASTVETEINRRRALLL
jgi:hypothetical protein